MLNFFEHVHYPNFLSPSSDLIEPRSQSIFFNVDVKK